VYSFGLRVAVRSYCEYIILYWARTILGHCE